MLLTSLIPLLLCFIATCITLVSDRKTLDGIPGPLAAIIGTICLIWFVAVSPWLVKLVLVVLVLLVAQRYLQETTKLG